MVGGSLVNSKCYHARGESGAWRNEERGWQGRKKRRGKIERRGVRCAINIDGDSPRVRARVEESVLGAKMQNSISKAVERVSSLDER